MSILPCHLLRGFCRNLFKGHHPVRYMHKGAYEGDGKTTITILNRDADYGLMVDGITPIGFKLNVGTYVLGPMIIFPRSAIGWNIRSSNDIHEDSLALFKVIIPRPDIVVLGLDDNYPHAAPLIVDFKRIMKKWNIITEVLPVDKACTTFNFLNAEKRYVVGVFLPPRKIEDIDMMRLQEVATRRAVTQTSHFLTE